MSKTDAITIFAEGTFEDQVCYLLGCVTQTVPLKAKVTTDR
jgi:hypothetical protein